MCDFMHGSYQGFHFTFYIGSQHKKIKLSQYCIHHEKMLYNQMLKSNLINLDSPVDSTLASSSSIDDHHANGPKLRSPVGGPFCEVLMYR